MKPRLEALPSTSQDINIWMQLCTKRQAELWYRLYYGSRACDRRDADRILRIMSHGCRFCGSNSGYGEIHNPDCVYVTDPSARRVWLRRGARIIE